MVAHKCNIIDRFMAMLHGEKNECYEITGYVNTTPKPPVNLINDKTKIHQMGYLENTLL